MPFTLKPDAWGVYLRTQISHVRLLHPPQEHFMYLNCKLFLLYMTTLVWLRVTQLLWGLFTRMCSVAKPSTAWLARVGSFSGLFPAWLLEESGVLWPCLGVQPWPSLIYWSSQSLFTFVSYSFDFIYLWWWEKEETETSSVTALCQESKLRLLASIS